MSPTRRNWSLGVCLGCQLAWASALAAAPAESNQVESNSVQSKQVEPGEATRLIAQLDAPDFSQRQEASRVLSAAGKEIFEPLERAAEAGSREVASRAVEILKRHFSAGDEATKQSARSSLERLADSGNVSAAQRASDVLHPPQEQQLPVGLNGLINPAMLPRVQRVAPQRRIVLGGIRIGVRPQIRGVANRTTVRNTNGLREIEVQEGDKITKVKDVAGGGLAAEITEQVNGKEATRKVEAKNLDELKQKEPAAAQLYEQHSRPAAGPKPSGPPVP